MAITYVWECTNCGAYLEVKSSITKKLPTRRKCQKCKEIALERVLFPTHVYNKPSDNDISVGLLADRNTQRFSTDYKEHLNKKHHTGVKHSEDEGGGNFWDVPPEKAKKLAEMTPEQQDKYIKTGEM
jgi:hypothetical protein